MSPLAANAFVASRPLRSLAGVVCLCASVAALTGILVVATGFRPVDEIWRVPVALFMAYVASSIARRGTFSWGKPRR